MTAAKHTPGPWKAWNIALGPGGHGPYSYPLGNDPEEAAANARLIAAAPELAEALRGLLTQLDGIGIPDWHGAEGLELTEARAALQKAGLL